MKILLIDNYDSFTYNLFHYISKFVKSVDVVRNDKIDGKTIIRKKYNKIVISPGPGNPNQAGNCLKIVKAVHKKIPILGVCLGHQSIGVAFGAKIIQAPEVFHGKKSAINHSGTALFQEIPNPYSVVRYHSLIIDNSTLPKDLKVTSTIIDNPKIIMGVEHVSRPIFGVQFHPESIDTDYGMQLIKNFLNI